ncbi:MAG: HD domain-containing protein [bacterium]
MKTSDIYKQYKLMPQLIKHQLRVAGVTKLITKSWDDSVLANKAVRACLLHDMGNMAKFTDLSDPFWIEEQKIFWEKYGQEAHEATYSILRELGFEEYVDILKIESSCYDIKNEKLILENINKPALMVLYSDLRVDLNGVVTLYERIKDLITRYPGSNRPETVWGAELERYVQILTPIKVTEINEAMVKPIFDDLLALEW